MFRSTVVAVLLVVVSCCQGVAADLTPAAASKLATLASIAQPVPLKWRYHVGDVADAASPVLDDSSWRLGDSTTLDWGQEPLCWLRTKVTIPAEVAHVKLDGSKIVFRCGIDDDGVIYIDGKEVQRFHWGEGSVVLTDKAVAGQSFTIAVKGINVGGPGRLLFSQVDVSALSSFSDTAASIVSTNDGAVMFSQTADAGKREQCVTSISKALEAVDTDLLAKGNSATFAASLKSAADQINSASAIVRPNIDLVGHAHTDLMWTWLWPETVDVFDHTFGTMIDLMNRYPGFTFSQSQPTAYLAIKEKDPSLYAKIKEKVKSGQWDVSPAACWGEGDLNMPSGEAIARSLLYGKRFMMQEFGVEPDVCWEPDTFGHAWTIPQILAKSGVKYYYFWRKGPGPNLFWWESPDGSRVFAYNYKEYWGNTREKALRDRTKEFTANTKTNEYMHIYGTGDHGGGPTADMLDEALALQKRSDFPKINFSKADDYFRTVLKSKQDFPAWNNEMNPTLDGCYTSHADIKRWNRECENALPVAETFAAIATNARFTYPTKDFESSWRKTCFSQFHDILDGTCIHSCYDYCGQLRDEVVSQASKTLDGALPAIMSSIKTEGKGVPVVVFNRLSWPRTDTVTVRSPFSGGSEYAKVIDDTGKAYPARIENGNLCFTARDVPATGYRVFWASQVNAPLPSALQSEGLTLENQFFLMQVDRSSGTIKSILDKRNNREVVAQGGAASLLQILMDAPSGNAWNFGGTQSTLDLTSSTGVTVISTGPAKSSISVKHVYDKSTFEQTITLCDGMPRIDIHLKADWQEQFNKGPMPVLKVTFQTSVKNGVATFEIPYGSIERKGDGTEMVGQKWIDLSEPAYGVSILNDCKYGFNVKDNWMRIGLLRCSSRPDRKIDMGQSEATWSIYPHAGDWRTAGTVRRAYELNEPLIARVASPHSGSLASSRSYLSISEPNLVVTAFKKAEDDSSYILRFYETDGKPCKGTITVNLPARAAVETDILERPIGKEILLKNKQFTVNAGKCEIKTYKILR